MTVKGHGYKKAWVGENLEHDVCRSEEKAKPTPCGEEEKERECGL